MDNSKITSVAMVEFLDWAESVLETESGGNKELGDVAYYEDTGDFVEGAEEEELYESEEECDADYFEIDETS